MICVQWLDFSQEQVFPLNFGPLVSFKPLGRVTQLLEIGFAGRLGMILEPVAVNVQNPIPSFVIPNRKWAAGAMRHHLIGQILLICRKLCYWNT